MLKYLGPIMIGAMLGLSCTVIGMRLHNIYKDCKRDEPKHMVRCMIIRDNLE